MQPLQEVQNLAAVLNQQQSSSGSIKANMATSAASNTQEALPVFDLSAFLALAGQPATHELHEQCKQLAECLARTGCLVVRDPRVSAAANDTFLDMLESYFSRSGEAKQAEARPELAYQVGVTPAGVEVPRCLVEPEVCRQQVQALQPEQQPTLPTGPDVKWRYMWRVGPRPASTQYAELNAAPVVPRGMPQWRAVMDDWGSKLLGAVEAVAAMAALGFGLPADAFTSRMALGPHLLAPTGSDLQQHGQQGTVLAGYHYDLNFITIHGRSRFPGLSVWLADGRRLPVSIPPGCLLCQAGKQLEWLTGGRVRAGMHEVLVTDATAAATAAAKAAGRSTWRVSSTVFSHIASDQLLQPLGHFAQQPGAAERYAPVPAGLQVQQELEIIQLKKQ
ncbi:Clavaminate synthase-like protein [Scenedesmus sp. NREL 46B-D3]|nr:Clavaminate synthase-like protein [Scenedesmus sp. NREL 46B-D3]